ncbi:MAG TPA: DUF72 domain-containing protein [Iamia sp.]|jgi:uncharacterized protein YecE (DUF72 family)|nr:DUF72 domain-containing protein [Iamia sp.]
MAILRVGCALWAHAAWRGRALPADLRRDEQLGAYASWCTAVEGNTTAYGLPAPATVAAWAAETPPGFRFLFKLPQDITHRGRLRDAEPAVAGVVELLAPLGDRCEQLFVQLPASFGPGDLGALATFLARVPDGPRWVVEVRHPAFFDSSPAGRTLERLLRDRGAEWATFDTTTLFADPPGSDAERDGWAKKPRLPRRVVALGERPVVRYLGRDDVDATVAGWQPWVPVVAGWLDEGRSPTVFIHTPDNDEALGLARRFHDEVRAAASVVVDPLPQPMAVPPTTLF